MRRPPCRATASRAVAASLLLVLLLNSDCVQAAKVCDVTQYGAKGDGVTDDTKAIQAALDDCKGAAGGGGEVVLPGGHRFLSFPLRVEGGGGGSGGGCQGLTLTLQPTAVLAAQPRDRWPVTGGAYVNFLQFDNCDGLTVTGGGLIDGGGTPWYIAFDNGQLNYSRPYLLVIETARNLTLTGLRLLNSPMYFVVLSHVTTAEISHLNLTAEWYDNGTKMPHNTDGIDPGSSSRGIHIHDVWVSNGDDSVAVKPGSLQSGCTRDILVENSVFSKGHGLSIGSVGEGCVENVVFRNNTLRGQLAGCRVKTYSKGPGYVRNITWENIEIYDTNKCITVSMNYKTQAKAAIQQTNYINITDLRLTNVKGSGCAVPAEFVCEAGMPCTGIVLADVDVSVGAKQKQMTCQFAHGTAAPGTVRPPSCLLP